MVSDGIMVIRSIRQSLRDMIHPPPNHLRPLDSWRSLAMIWIVLQHSLLVAFGDDSSNAPAAIAASHNSFYRFFFHAHFGVDVFYVLSGFLISRILMRELKTTATIHFSRFYLRRIFRMLPIYYAIMLFVILLIHFNLIHYPHDFSWAWANFLQINNFVPRRLQFMSWTWSLAIEEQFYLIIPVYLYWAYRSEKRFLLVTFALISMTCIAQFVFLKINGEQLHWAIFRFLESDQYDRYFDGIYDKIYFRLSTLLIGAIGAHLYETGRLQRFFSHSFRGLGAALTGLLFIGFVFHFMSYGYGSETKDAWFLSVYREIFSVGLMILIAASLCIARFNKLISLSIFYPIFQLAYGSYLLHLIIAPLILGCFVHFFEIKAYTPLNLFCFGSLVMIASLIVTIPFYIGIEKPFMDLRKKLF